MQKTWFLEKGSLKINYLFFVEDHTCMCDAERDESRKEGGYLSNRDILPVSQVVVGDVQGSAGYRLGMFQCAQRPFGTIYFYLIDLRRSI